MPSACAPWSGRCHSSTPADASSAFRHRGSTGPAAGRRETAAASVAMFSYCSDIARKRPIPLHQPAGGRRYPASPRQRCAVKNATAHVPPIGFALPRGHDRPYSAPGHGLVPSRRARAFRHRHGCRHRSSHRSHDPTRNDGSRQRSPRLPSRHGRFSSRDATACRAPSAHRGEPRRVSRPKPPGARLGVFRCQKPGRCAKSYPPKVARQ